MKKTKDIAFIFVLLFLTGILFFFNIGFGNVTIGWGDIVHILSGGKAENVTWSYIVENRLNRSLAAIFAGGALGVSGLILQVFFRNPLAGPGVLGITSGATLGVAVVLLSGVTMYSFIGSISLLLAGVVGALTILLLLLFVSRFIRYSVTLLVVGLMFGYFTSALINMFSLWATESSTRAYVVWGLGSFDNFSNTELYPFIIAIVIPIIACLLLIKPLNALAAGTDFASVIGINLKLTRTLIVVITGVLAAVVTIYCGPVGFIGIAVPQFVRIFLKSVNHALIIPAVFVGGALLAILADFVVRMSGNVLPLNTVTALIGAPIIIAVIIKLNKRNVGV